MNPITDKETRQERLRLCRSCPEVCPKKVKCLKCGCFVQLKVTYSKSKCPLKRW